MTERSLPVCLQDAQKQHEGRIFRYGSHEVVHAIRFFFHHEDGHDEIVAEFVASGAIYVPSEEQTVMLHDVPVTATRIEVTYGATKDGIPAIIAEVAVVPFEET